MMDPHQHHRPYVLNHYDSPTSSGCCSRLRKVATGVSLLVGLACAGGMQWLMFQMQETMESMRQDTDAMRVATQQMCILMGKMTEQPVQC